MSRSILALILFLRPPVQIHRRLPTILSLLRKSTITRKTREKLFDHTSKLASYDRFLLLVADSCFFLFSFPPAFSLAVTSTPRPGISLVKELGDNTDFIESCPPFGSRSRISPTNTVISATDTVVSTTDTLTSPTARALSLPSMTDTGNGKGDSGARRLTNSYPAAYTDFLVAQCHAFTRRGLSGRCAMVLRLSHSYARRQLSLHALAT